MRNGWNNKACSTILFLNKVWQNVKAKIQWWVKGNNWNLAISSNHKQEWQKARAKCENHKCGKNLQDKFK